MATRAIRITITGDADRMAKILRWPRWRRVLWLKWRRVIGFCRG